MLGVTLGLTGGGAVPVVEGEEDPDDEGNGLLVMIVKEGTKTVAVVEVVEVKIVNEGNIGVVVFADWAMIVVEKATRATVTVAAEKCLILDICGMLINVRSIVVNEHDEKDNSLSEM